MLIENVKVSNFEGAIRGMRNPLDSWDKSDSYFGIMKSDSDMDYKIADKWVEKYGMPFDHYHEWLLNNGIINDLYPFEGIKEVAFLGPNDMDLADRLLAGGTEHRKFLRQIFVSMDITAPLYWWKEMDTYKVATVTNSCSTMHTLAKNEKLGWDQFETDDFASELVLRESGPESTEPYVLTMREEIEDTIFPLLNTLLHKYKETNHTEYWKELIRWLPCGWLQKRTWTGNYETLRTIYKQRYCHKLTEWHTLCAELERLPYAADFICY